MKQGRVLYQSLTTLFPSHSQLCLRGAQWGWRGPSTHQARVAEGELQREDDGGRGLSRHLLMGRPELAKKPGVWVKRSCIYHRHATRAAGSQTGADGGKKGLGPRDKEG